MDDGEVDFSNTFLSSPNMGEMPSICSLDSLNMFDFAFNDTHACTHTHTCNPPGPDLSHTHTCFHVHTKIVSGSAPSEDNAGTDDTAESTEKKSKKRPSGNKEAVRKYREKKKAREASLKDEVKDLRAVNQQLLKKLQGQAVLEAENARLKCLLVDIRGRIEGEIGSFPYQKPTFAHSNMSGAYMMNPCSMQCPDLSKTNMQCNDQVYRPLPGVDGKGGEGVAIDGQDFSGCGFENLQCLVNQNVGVKDLPGCGLAVSDVNSTGTNKRRVKAWSFD